MTYYRKKYRAKKKLSEKGLIQAIKNLKNEILRLESLRNDYLNYKTRRIKYEEQERKLIDPLYSFKKRLIEDKSNYKRGIKYFFIERELKEEVKTKIRAIENSIKQKYGELEKIYRVKKSPYCGFELKSSEIDGRIDYEINKHIPNLKNQIDKYKLELEKEQNKNQKIENIYGLAAQATKTSRQRANTIKNKMVINNYCPYCGEEIDDAHIDHIYPVAKGGLSTTKNMVRVCCGCNIKKRDLTLNQFIKKYSLDREFIEKNLEKLNKNY